MWLAVAVDFDPEDASFFESKVKPLLLARRMGQSDLRKFRPQVESLKRFLLNNFPAVVCDVVSQIQVHVDLQHLTVDEKRFLQLIQTYQCKPKDLLRLQKMSGSRGQDNRVSRAFRNCTILKPSYTNIKFS